MKKIIRRLPAIMDSLISGTAINQLKWFSIITISIIVLLMLFANIFEIHLFSGVEGINPMQGILYYFFDPGNLHMDSSQCWIIQLFTMLIAFLGMALLGGLLITTMSNIVERRVNSIERGLVTYKNIENHYVIIGYSEVTICLINDIYFERESKDINKLPQQQRTKIIKSLPKILIFTGEEISTVRAEIHSHFSPEIARNVILYSGNIESGEHLLRLNINTAKEVYILGDKHEYGRDSKNLSCVKHIAKLRGPQNPSNGILNVNVQFDRMPSYSNIQKLSIPKHYIRYDVADQNPNIYFRPFNFYENWSRLLWSYYKDSSYKPLDFEQLDDKKHVHLVIVGFNRMGRALLLEALRLCHYINYDVKNPKTKTRITIVDCKMDEHKSVFTSQYPYIKTIEDIDVEFINDYVESDEVRMLLDKFAQDENSLLTIAICLKDPDLSLATGLSLPESVYFVDNKIDSELVKGDRYKVKNNRMRTNVLIRQELQYGLGEILDQDNKRYKNIKIFGMLTNGISYRLLDDTLPMEVNSSYNDLMQNKYKNGETSEYVLESILNWANLSENVRWANRYQIDMFDYYKRILSANGVENLQSMETIREGLLESLADAEHRRWKAERSVSGWRQIEDTEKRIDEFQHHNQIIPTQKLTDDQKDKDKTVIKNIFSLEIKGAKINAESKASKEAMKITRIKSIFLKSI